MEPETELDDALIDAFDADPAPTRDPAATAAPLRRKMTPLEPRGGLQHAEKVAPTATRQAPQRSAPLRHYPSLDALERPSTYATAPYVAQSVPSPQSSAASSSMVTPQFVQYPRLDMLDASPIMTRPNSVSPVLAANVPVAKTSAPRLSQDQLPEDPVKAERETVRGPLDRSPHVVSQSAPQNSLADQPSPEEQTMPASKPTSTTNTNIQVPANEPVPTDEEIEIQRHHLEAEVHRFEQQSSYMALALAGETLHQLEMRRVREEERKEREERRLAAVAHRLEHAVERELQREARVEERRVRHVERTHRSSVSPSPEREERISPEREANHDSPPS